MVGLTGDDGNVHDVYHVVSVQWGKDNEWATEVSEQLDWAESLRLEMIALNAARMRRQMILQEIDGIRTELS